MVDPDAHLFAPRRASAPLSLRSRNPERLVGAGLAAVAIALVVLLLTGQL